MTPDCIAIVGSLLPRYVWSIADLHALSLTSRDLRHAVLSHLTPRALYAILYRSAGTLFPLQPDHTLLGLIAKGFARWLGESVWNRALFKKASLGGTPSYLLLALDTDIPTYAHLDLGAVRATMTTRDAIAVGLADLLDVCVGKQWYDVEDYWDGGRLDARTLYADPDEMVYLWATYGEMFGGSVEGWYAYLVSLQTGARAVDGVTLGPKGEKRVGGSGRVGRGEERMGLECRGTELSVRMEWVKYSMPDWHTDYETYRGNRPWGWESDYPTDLDDLHEDGPACNGTQLDDKGVSADGGGEDGGYDNRAYDNVRTDLPSVNPQLSPGSLREDVPIVPHTGDPPIPPDSDSEDSDAPDRPTDDESPDAHAPSVHPLRAVRHEGAYADTHALGRLEHPTCMLHLFEKSPLFNRLTRRVRLRAARLARSTGSVDGCTPVSASSPEDIRGDDRCGEDECRGDRHRDDGPEDDDLEFGKTTYQCGDEDFPTWKQLLWEDALHTAGWDGLELVADEWEWDAENWKAIQRRTRRCGGGVVGCGQRSTEDAFTTRSIDGSTPPERGVSARELNCQNTQRGVTDNHPGLQRLVRIYRHLEALTHEPDRVALRSIERPDRFPVETYLVPFMLGDMRLAIWDSRMGPCWRIKR